MITPFQNPHAGDFWKGGGGGFAYTRPYHANVSTLLNVGHHQGSQCVEKKKKRTDDFLLKYSLILPDILWSL